MYGAIIGDIVGSKYEFRPINTKDFPFVSKGCEFTDDTVMTVAVARALMKARERNFNGEPASFRAILVAEMQELGRRFPGAGYGGMFAKWLGSPDPRPYNSYGNGSAMRVSPCGLFAVTLDETLALAKASSEVTHDHPEGIRGAQAVAACIFLAKAGKTKMEIHAYVEDNFYKPLPSIGDIRPVNTFDETCQGSVPQAIACFLESTDYEDAVRNAVSLGGDADTQAAIAGSIAWTYYRFGCGFRDNPDDRYVDKEGRIWTQSCEDVVAGYRIDELLPDDFVATIEEFDVQRMLRAGTYDRTGFCTSIPL